VPAEERSEAEALPGAGLSRSAAPWRRTEPTGAAPAPSAAPYVANPAPRAAIPRPYGAAFLRGKGTDNQPVLTVDAYLLGGHSMYGKGMFREFIEPTVAWDECFDDSAYAIRVPTGRFEGLEAKAVNSNRNQRERGLALAIVLTAAVRDPEFLRDHGMEAMEANLHHDGFPEMLRVAREVLLGTAPQDIPTGPTPTPTLQAARLNRRRLLADEPAPSRAAPARRLGWARQLELSERWQSLAEEANSSERLEQEAAQDLHARLQRSEEEAADFRSRLKSAQAQVETLTREAIERSKTAYRNQKAYCQNAEEASAELAAAEKAAAQLCQQEAHAMRSLEDAESRATRWQSEASACEAALRDALGKVEARSAAQHLQRERDEALVEAVAARGEARAEHAELEVATARAETLHVEARCTWAEERAMQLSAELEAARAEMRAGGHIEARAALQAQLDTARARNEDLVRELEKLRQTTAAPAAKHERAYPEQLREQQTLIANLEAEAGATAVQGRGAKEQRPWLEEQELQELEDDELACELQKLLQAWHEGQEAPAEAAEARQAVEEAAMVADPAGQTPGGTAPSDAATRAADQRTEAAPARPGTQLLAGALPPWRAWRERRLASGRMAAATEAVTGMPTVVPPPPKAVLPRLWVPVYPRQVPGAAAGAGAAAGGAHGAQPRRQLPRPAAARARPKHAEPIVCLTREGPSGLQAAATGAAASSGAGMATPRPHATAGKAAFGPGAASAGAAAAGTSASGDAGGAGVFPSPRVVPPRPPQVPPQLKQANATSGIASAEGTSSFRRGLWEQPPRPLSLQAQRPGLRLATCRRCHRPNQKIERSEHVVAGFESVPIFILDCTNEQCGSHQVKEDGTPVQSGQRDEFTRVFALLKASRSSTQNEQVVAKRLFEREKRRLITTANDVQRPQQERAQAHSALSRLATEEREVAPKAKPAADPLQGAGWHEWH